MAIVPSGASGEASAGAARTRVPMTPLRKTAIIAGALYLVTFATSIPTLPLLAPAQAPGFVLGPGPDGGVLWGALLNVICALAGVGTAVALYPMVKRQNGALAIGFVASRVIEGTRS